MERIIEHIERLLLQHDCVIIPDFGGFVLQRIPAVYQEDDHFFTPARKEIVFNPTLMYNDGLLIESYMQRYSTDFAKAQTLVRKEVTALKEVLDDHAELKFGKIGLFFKEEERLLFLPATRSEELFNVPSFGLPVFHFLPLTARDTTTVNSILAPEPKKETPTDQTVNRRKNVVYHIPVTRLFLQIVATTAAAILLFLFLATPVSDVNHASYSASFVPREILLKKTTDEMTAEAHAVSNETVKNVVSSDGENEATDAHLAFVKPDPTSPASPEPTAVSPNPSSASPKHASTISSKTTSSKPAHSKTTSSKLTHSNSLKYYVVIGSFKSKTNAQVYINRLKGIDTANTGTIVRDGWVYVYNQTFTSQKEAESYQKKIRQNPNHTQAWIYKGL